MKWCKGYLLLALFGVGCMVQAAVRGGWVSGGGEILKDSLNPWFLQNTKTVNYCIKIDEKNFGLTKQQVNAQIQKALSFWQKEFGLLGAHDIGGGQKLQVGTQKFKQVKCNKNTDVTFQFGILNQQQKDYLVEPKEFAAVSVRTDYDTETLKAKGFLYFSPYQGPLAYNVNKKKENLWALNDQQPLYLSLVHELGHVFGLPHLGNIYDVMSKSFVDYVLKAASEDPIISSLNFFSLPKSSNLICSESMANWQNYFDVPATEKCFQFKFEHDSKSEFFRGSVLKIYTSASKSEPLKLAHKINLQMTNFFPEVYLGTIYLPDGQKVFESSCVEFLTENEVSGVSLLSYTKTGQFKLNTSDEVRGISVKFKQGSSLFSLQLVVNNQIVTVL